MGTTRETGGSLTASLREHVLSPLETAEQRIDRECEEVVTERNAYRQFNERVSGIKTVATPRQHPGSVGHTYLKSRSQTAALRSKTVKRIRSAFRATVMSVEHYEELYGESLDEHVVAELSPEAATLFQDDRATPMTRSDRTVLVTAVERAITQRDAYLDVVGGERDSLEMNRQTLSNLLAEYGGPKIPAGHRSELRESLDELAESRQETLNDRPSRSRTDGHDLCSYIYREYDWSYPVLTALTRFRSTII